LPARLWRDILTPHHCCGDGASVSVEFLLTSFIVIISPGTGVLYTLAAGLSRGSRASVVAAFGCTIGIVPHMAAAIMGSPRSCTPARSHSRPSNIWALPIFYTWPGTRCASGAP
jgi:hypothetical protein